MDDRAELHDLVARYADAVCRRDEPTFAATWAENALWQLPGMPLTEGREAIVALWLSVMARFPFVIQRMNNGTVEITGDIASGRWYLNEHIAGEDGSVMINVGVYQDRYVRNNSVWQFSERHFSMLYHERRASPEGVVTADFPELL